METLLKDSRAGYIWDRIFDLSPRYFLNLKEQNISATFLKQNYHTGRFFDIQDFQ